MSLDTDEFAFDPEGDVTLLIEIYDDGDHREDLLDSDSNETRDESSSFATALENATLEGLIVNHISAANINDSLQVEASEGNVDSGRPRINYAKPEEKHVSFKARKLLQTVRMRVSSRHLALASPIFGDMFANTITTQGKMSDREIATVPLEGDNIEAMKILLNIVHGYNRSAPRQLDIQTLWQVVTLIEKYEFYEVAELHTEKWFKTLLPKFQRQASDELGYRGYVCLELKQPGPFNIVTQIAVMETSCEFPSAQYSRIPYWIIDEMRSRRQRRLDEVISGFAKLIAIYEGPYRICDKDNDCDPLVLGKLIRRLKSIDLYPVPDSTRLTMSLETLFSELRKLNLPELYSHLPGYLYKSNRSTVMKDEVRLACSQYENLRNWIHSKEHNKLGLDLDTITMGNTTSNTEGLSV